MGQGYGVWDYPSPGELAEDERDEDILDAIYMDALIRHYYAEIHGNVIYPGDDYNGAPAEQLRLFSTDPERVPAAMQVPTPERYDPPCGGDG